VRFLEFDNAGIRRYLAKKHSGSPADHDIDREAPLHQSFRELQYGSLQTSAGKAMEHQRDPSTAIRILQRCDVTPRLQQVVVHCVVAEPPAGWWRST
jgi:hypothetical protein